MCQDLAMRSIIGLLCSYNIIFYLITQLLFIGRPTITTHPINRVTNASMSVTLKCKGHTGGDEKYLKYHWESSDVNNDQWMNISDSNGESLVIKSLEKTEKFRCIVSNEAGSTPSNVAIVTLMSKLLSQLV